jgi:hypothetical protein
MDTYINQLNVDLQEQQVGFVLPHTRRSFCLISVRCDHGWQNDPMFRQRAFVTDEDIRGIPSFRDQVYVCADPFWISEIAKCESPCSDRC